VILAVIATAYLVFRSQPVQTMLVRLTAEHFSRELKTVIRVGGFDLSIRNGLMINGILILDQKKDTLLKAAEISVRPGKFSLREKKLNINKIMIRDGIFQLLTHKGDSTINLQFILDYFASTDSTPADSSKSKPFSLTVSNLGLSGMHFRMQDGNETPVAEGMDYSNLDVSHIELDLRDISFDEMSIHAKIHHLAANERCGLNLHNLSGSFQVGSRFLKAKGLKIKTDRSDINLDFDFLYGDWNAYNDFLSSVVIRANFDSSALDMSDIGFFAPELTTMTDRFNISGSVKGTVNNLRARNLDLSFGKKTRFRGDVNMLGLPDFEETFMDFNVRELVTTREDIEQFRLPAAGPAITLPPVIQHAGNIRLSGKFTGFYNDFVATGILKSDIGTVVTDLALFRQKESNLIGYKGKVEARALDLGILTGSPGLFGSAKFIADVNGKGFTIDDAGLTMNVTVDSIRFNGYTYSSVNITGSLAEKLFKGSIETDDPNLALRFTGNIDMRDSIPAFDFLAEISQAQLFNLNLLQRDSINTFSSVLSAKIKGTNPDNLDGSFSMKHTNYQEGKGVISMDHLSLLTRQDTVGGKSYHLQSDFLDADLSGDFSFSAIIPSITNFVNRYLQSFNLTDTVLMQKLADNDQVLKYNIKIKQPDEITAVFLPFLKISPGSLIYGVYDDRKDVLAIKGEARSIKLNDFKLENWYLDAETRPDNLTINSGASSFYLENEENKDTTSLRMDSLLLLSDIHHDTILYNLSWIGNGQPSVIGGFLNFFNTPEIELKIRDFDVFLADKSWKIDPRNRIVFDSSSIGISDLLISSSDQYLKIYGAVSEDPADTISLIFNKLDISKADKLAGLDAINIDGILQGKLRLTNLYKELILLADLTIQKFRFNNELLGDATFSVRYDDQGKKIDVNSSIIYTGNIGTNVPFILGGTVSLKGKTPELNLKLALKNLNLKMFNPFVNDFMSGIAGLATGEVKILGNPQKPLITGKMQFMRTEFKINYMNVPWSFADVVTIDTSAFIFNKITLFDSLGHKAVLNGKITHNHFSDLALDLYAEMDDFAAYNTVKTRESLFFGKARASGTVSITGPVDNLKIDVKASNGGKTHITIPIDLTRSVNQADYIIFVDPDGDSLDIAKTPVPREVNNTGLSLDMALRVNDDAEVEVFFPEQLGNLKASGSGNLLMTMTPVTPFTLAGTYKLTKGYFLFQLKNYLRLPMSLMEGSSISWSGDPADANVFINAVYKTKAPLKGLTTDPSLEATRVPVESIIRIQGKLMNPEISFALKLPNVEESIKNQVFAVIDTTNPVVMAEQTFYLLVLNQFKPVVGTSTNMDMSSTAFSLVTNQLNSMISQLSTNVSVNMNYKPATSTTAQEFDVGISTQLFNDRLLIDGTFGMNNNVTTSTQTSTIVGDINIEYVLTKNRRWRVRAFNRTNTTTMLNNNAPYTQGVGIKYQRDFSTFRELFRPGKSKH
jgi:hypothetical protein